MHVQEVDENVNVLHNTTSCGESLGCKLHENDEDDIETKACYLFRSL